MDTATKQSQLSVNPSFIDDCKRLNADDGRRISLSALQLMYPDYSLGTVSRAYKLVLGNAVQNDAHESTIPTMDDYTPQEFDERTVEETDQYQDTSQAVTLVDDSRAIVIVDKAMTANDVFDSLEEISRIADNTFTEMESLHDNARYVIGQRAAQLKSGDNWKAVNEVASETAETWEQFCKMYFRDRITKGIRQYVDRCITDYVIASELPKELIGPLKPAHLQFIATLPSEQRIPVLTAALEQAPHTDRGTQISTALLKKVLQQQYPDESAPVAKNTEPSKNKPVVADDIPVIPTQTFNKSSTLTRPAQVILLQWKGWIEKAIAGEQGSDPIETLQTILDDIAELSASIK